MAQHEMERREKRRLTVLLRTSFPDGSSVGAAENLIPERFGTQPRNTAATSGNVAKSMKVKNPAPLPILPSMK